MSEVDETAPTVPSIRSFNSNSRYGTAFKMFLSWSIKNTPDKISISGVTDNSIRRLGVESGLTTSVTEGKKTASTTWAGLQTGALWKHLIRPVPVTLVDLLSLIGIFFLADYIVTRSAVIEGLNLQNRVNHMAISATFIAASLALLWLLRFRGSLVSEPQMFRWTQLVGVVSFASMMSAFAWLIFSPEAFDQLYIVLVWTLSVLLLPLGEFVVGRTFELIRLNNSHHTPVIIVGTDSSASIARRRFEQEANRYVLVGTLDLMNGKSNGQDRRDLSRMIDISAYAKSNGGILVATPADKYTQLRSIFESYSLTETGRVNVTLYPSSTGEDADTEADSWQPRKFSWWYEKLKRSIDLTIALSSLILASPLILFIAALIKLDSRGPLLFNQTRVGRDGQLFSMYKFRSMCADAEDKLDELTDMNEASGQMFKMADDPRVTRVGKVIRRLSLDEIPQLLNVIKGNMSIIGPRPPLPHEVKEYQPWHFRRFEAVPGITGLWQVNRGEEISFDEMVELDIEYIEQWSVWKDIAILLKTIPAMLRGQGAY